DGLYVFRADGGGAERRIDGEIGDGLAWQASPANLSVTVTDGHGDELHGLVVELRDFADANTVDYAHPANPTGGNYLFEGVAPGRYRLRARLDDAESSAFEVRHGYPRAAAEWAEREVVLAAGVEKLAIDFDLEDSGLLATSLEEPVRDRLDDLAAIYF